jgi:hypothetical protein
VKIDQVVDLSPGFCTVSERPGSVLNFTIAVAFVQNRFILFERSDVVIRQSGTGMISYGGSPMT